MDVEDVFKGLVTISLSEGWMSANSIADSGNCCRRASIGSKIRNEIFENRQNRKYIWRDLVE